MRIELEGALKRFGSDVVAVSDLDLAIESGEFFALLGPSGCGKSTTLRLVAGLEQLDAGIIRFDGAPVADNTRHTAPEDRGVGLVFQDYALFPHLTVADNIAFPLEHFSTGERIARIKELTGMVGIEGLDRRYPHELSGGQQQRVALARAMANHPSIMLLDEPFSNLDASLRGTTREDVKAVLASQGITTILVTHDREEAFSLADRVGVMVDGELEQVGTPEEIYAVPAGRTVARLGGSASLLPGVANGSTVHCEIGTFTLAAHQQGEVDVLIRPETLRLIPNEHGMARVIGRSFLGPVWQFALELPSGQIVPARVDGMTAHSIDGACDVGVQGAVVAFPVAW